MTSVVEIPIMKKHVICRVCGLDSTETRFQINRRICNKCNSKHSNEKLKQERPEYFRNYMKAHYVSVKKIKKSLETFEN